MNWFKSLQRWLGRGKDPGSAQAQPHGIAASEPVEAAEPMPVADFQPYPYDENLLERTRTQWQFGDWESLAQLTRDTLQHHPDRAKLALLAAAGRLQTGQDAEARVFVRLAQDWGVSKKLVRQILIAGVHNSLGCAAAVAGQKSRALKNFESSITVGMPGADARLVTQARITEQVKRFDLVDHRLGSEQAPWEAVWASSFSKKEGVDGQGGIKEGLLKGKKVLILLWFRSLVGGGLHENVLDTVIAILSQSGEPIVVCPESNFSKFLKEMGVVVYETNYDDQDLAQRIQGEHPHVDLIHVHPGLSRKLGMKLNEEYQCPLVMTIHSKWIDDVDKFYSHLSLVVGVSEYICEVLRKLIPGVRSKLKFIPNGVDERIFNPARQVFSNRSALFVGRLDKDKQVSIELMYRLWELQRLQIIPSFDWVVAGDGPLADEIRLRAQAVFQSDGVVHFAGWVSRPELAEFYSKASFAIAGGRACLEALSCACPAIACGAENMIPIQSLRDLDDAAYSNFGEFGTNEAQRTEENLMLFLDRLGSAEFDDLMLDISTILRSNRGLRAVNESICTTYQNLLKDCSRK